MILTHRSHLYMYRVCFWWILHAGGWLQPCSECWIFHGWFRHNPHHEEVTSHMGNCTHAHWNLQISSVVSPFLRCHFEFWRSNSAYFEFLLFSCTNLHIVVWRRSDVVEIETWCQGEGRIGTRRDWILKDYATGQIIGKATRWIIGYFSIINFYWKLKSKNCRSYQYYPKVN